MPKEKEAVNTYELLCKSLLAMLDDYGFPDDQPANYRSPRSIGNKNLHGWHTEVRKVIRSTKTQA